MKDNFLLKQLAQAVVDSHETYIHSFDYCSHCDAEMSSCFDFPHKPHCIVLVAEQILKGNEDE